MSEDQINRLIYRLSEYSDSDTVTNPYYGNSRESIIRRSNLLAYLQKMKDLHPKILLLGEAPGYNGCRLTGIPFTSEKVINDNDFFCSRFQVVNSHRFTSEISATIVWSTLSELDRKPLIWNIFPFHPHKESNCTSNRTPTKNELIIGKEYLDNILSIYKIDKIIALGRKPQSQLTEIGIPFEYVRHPAQGGKNQFVDGLKKHL